MAPELEEQRHHQVTQIRVRIDCNGCLHKIKKALHGIKGIYEYNIDSAQQMVTIVGWADPEKIVKAIRKTNRMATICSQTEQPVQSSSQQLQQETPENATAAAEAATLPPLEPPAASATEEAKPTTEPLQDTEAAAASTTATTSHPAQSSGSNHVDEEVHTVHHYPHSYGYGGQWDNNSSIGHGRFRPEPVYVTQSYNTYNPPPYLTEYQYVNSPSDYTYLPPYHYNDIDYRNSNNENGNITYVFSDENPNACRIA